MEYLYVILSLLIAAIGLLGAVLPVLPGTPISFAAILVLLLCDGHDIGVTQLVVAGVLALAITMMDYVAPIWFTKKSGGSKAGMFGATIGLVVGLCLGPFGVILGPFFGAWIGELYAKTPRDKALKVAAMTFVAFMLTTGIKLIFGVVVFVMLIVKAWHILVP